MTKNPMANNSTKPITATSLRPLLAFGFVTRPQLNYCKLEQKSLVKQRFWVMGNKLKWSRDCWLFFKENNLFSQESIKTVNSFLRKRT